jgi:catechol 2,3-dioxygenase-like lactoylglutathione lyase family enzyme
MTGSEEDAVRVENTIPILRVEDLDASIAYYCDVLGFTVSWREDAMAEVARSGQRIMFCEGSQGSPGTWVWMGVTDAAALYAEIAPKGAIIRMAPKNFPWAYEMQIEDPDGHVLRIGSGPLEDSA